MSQLSQLFPPFDAGKFAQIATTANGKQATKKNVVIQLDQISKSFALPAGKHFDAVKDVSLQIQSGDIFGLIGKSGAGKSTLLRLINLLEQPDSGTVTVNQLDLTALDKSALRKARQSIGMIFQQFNLLQNASVFQNIALPLKIHGGFNRLQIAERVRECLALVDLVDKADSYPSQLSGGQKQRVAIARALASHPAVLLCDEPSSALDAETTRALLATLRDINARLGVTIVIVTHELSVVHELCEHVAVIENGVIAEQISISDYITPRKTLLGKELVHYARFAQSILELQHSEEQTLPQSNQDAPSQLQEQQSRELAHV
ncbi:ATP-binding cassette domain-containing protein [Undibacterium sp. 5I1]|uniref:methionine ABC transporter ATP-binding protein n=1 Tax=unclassified Undibacterium TaxID=2630295 RepID=UPI002AB35BC1|nr:MULTISPECIES: ATP-binding cassette domain-containing protein [unclassified Undibacterium]MDY7537461.1 ATP-binding cassette domain-containing protein [Undibacterium sp. 5I1]MEB0230958.1 ATP-binding cassette domain-containing protein [Undibacterium sp. 10I3]MEB0258203.1 ATP-binding cassette domain-containing protein [Undibacterium sp. 5I1]